MNVLQYKNGNNASSTPSSASYHQRTGSGNTYSNQQGLRPSGAHNHNNSLSSPPLSSQLSYDSGSSSVSSGSKRPVPGGPHSGSSQVSASPYNTGSSKQTDFPHVYSAVPTAPGSSLAGATEVTEGGRGNPNTLLVWEDKDDEDEESYFQTGKGYDDKTPFILWSLRGIINGLTIFILLGALLVLFAGYPIITHFHTSNHTVGNGYNLATANGQVPVSIPNHPTLIDPDTPTSAYNRTGFDGNEWNLVFSDEFETEGRTFYDGDDAYFQGLDGHYWATGDFEYYDPGAITTVNGKLQIAMTQQPIHGLNFKSGMLQSWNKLCFSGSAYIEASVSLPGNNKVGGFWPGVWTMGNLGRPGYGATTEGTWPYSYDACDIGTLANQTNPDKLGPEAALDTGSGDSALSYLPGQKLSACTCQGEDHPGPNVGVGRSAPEIDIIEAQIVTATQRGEVSQSLQLAPFDDYYQFNNASEYVEIYDETVTSYNSYLGGVYQQAASALTLTDSDNYFDTSGGFGVYGLEYYGNMNDRDNGYITWVSSGLKSWTIKAGAIGPNSRVGVSQRLIPEEPMALVVNFGMSNNFQSVDFEGLTFPNYVYIEYIRVWQRSDFGSVGCDPADHPTSDYISRHLNAYNDNNLTTWAQAGETFPKNSLIDTC